MMTPAEDALNILKFAVPTVTRADAASCSHNPLSGGNLFPDPKDSSKTLTILGSARVEIQGSVLGWIYRGEGDRFFAQANGLMPKILQQESQTFVAPYNGGTVLGTSGLVEITKIPWMTLTVTSCKAPNERPAS